MGWKPKPHITYTLGEVLNWSIKEEVHFRAVIITISRVMGIPKTQRIELPELEARRMVRLMSADLY